MSDRPVIEANAIYTREEAAQVLGVSLSTLKYLIRAGHLAVSQPAGLRRILIKGSYILDMLDRTEREPQALANVSAKNHPVGRQTGLATSAPAHGSRLAVLRTPNSGKGNSHSQVPALRAKRAIKQSSDLSRNASGKKFAKIQGGVSG